MKKSLVVLLLMVSIAYSQYPPIDWELTYEGDGTVKFYAMEVLENRDRIFVGWADTSSVTGTDALVVKTDSVGMIIWSNTYGGDEWDVGQELVLNSDGSMIILGSTTSFGAQETDVWVFKIDSNGNQLWSNIYGGAESEYFPKISRNSDDTYIILSKSDSFTDFTTSWLFKLNADGVMIWDLSLDNNANESAGGLISGDDGYTIVSQSGSDFSFVRVDTSGSIILDIVINPDDLFGDASSPTVHGCTVLDNGNILVAGNIYTDSQHQMIYEVSLDGVVQWSKILSSTGRGLSAIELVDGNYALLGHIDSGSTYISITLITDNRDEIISTLYGESGTNYSRYLKETDHGDLLVCGYKTISGSPAGWIFELDLGLGTEILSIDDVPGDQGGWVTVSWSGSIYEYNGMVNDYGVWEQDLTGEWVSLGTVHPTLDDEYTFLAHTFVDSGAEGNSLSNFRISTHTIHTFMMEYSDPFEGYSVDNLVPGVPEGLLVSLLPESIELTWESVTDLDFNYYNVYRSTESGFDPSELEPQYVTTTQMITDTDFEMELTYYYRVSAVDFHGNEGECSDEVSASMVSMDDHSEIPREFILGQNFPNPFNPSTTLRYGLQEDSDVSLIIYDIRGNTVRTIESGAQVAGWHEHVWNGINDDGHPVSTGLYVTRLRAGSYTETIKMVYLR